MVIKGLKVKIPPIKPMTWKQKVYDKGVATEARKKTFLTAKAGHMGEDSIDTSGTEITICSSCMV